MQQGIQPPAELQETFQNVFKYGNTLGKSPRQRLDWAKDLDVRVLDLSQGAAAGRGAVAGGLLSVVLPAEPGGRPGLRPDPHRAWASPGACSAPRRRRSANATGCSARKGCSRRSSRTNRKLLDKQDFGKLVVLDPHAYPRLQNFYPRFGAWYPVQHYTMFLAERLEQLQAADGQAGRGDGHLSRQLLRGPALRVLRSAAGAAATDPRA